MHHPTTIKITSLLCKQFFRTFLPYVRCFRNLCTPPYHNKSWALTCSFFWRQCPRGMPVLVSDFFSLTTTLFMAVSHVHRMVVFPRKPNFHQELTYPLKNLGQVHRPRWGSLPCTEKVAQAQAERKDDEMKVKNRRST